MFDIVVAADLDWGIGKANALPWPRLRDDLRHFKRVTSTASEGRRNAVIMGRKTWESREVAGKPLPNRINVVVSRGAPGVPDGVLVASSLDEALVGAGAAAAETSFVVGGAALILAAIDHRDLRHVYLTRIDQSFGCDVTMPDLDARGFVRDAWDGEHQAADNGVQYRIERLQRA